MANDHPVASATDGVGVKWCVERGQIMSGRCVCPIVTERVPMSGSARGGPMYHRQRNLSRRLNRNWYGILSGGAAMKTRFLAASLVVTAFTTLFCSAAKADALTGFSDVTVVGGAIVSLRYDGTEYVVANEDLMLGTTTRWYIPAATGVATLWAEGIRSPQRRSPAHPIRKPPTWARRATISCSP